MSVKELIPLIYVKKYSFLQQNVYTVYVCVPYVEREDIHAGRIQLVHPLLS
jgi:hypothetical protein